MHRILYIFVRKAGFNHSLENHSKRTEHVEKSTYMEYIVYDYQTISSKRIKFPAEVSDSIWFYGEKERSTWLGNDDQTCTSEVITKSSSEFGLGPRLTISINCTNRWFWKIIMQNFINKNWAFLRYEKNYPWQASISLSNLTERIFPVRCKFEHFLWANRNFWSIYHLLPIWWPRSSWK